MKYITLTGERLSSRTCVDKDKGSKKTKDTGYLSISKRDTDRQTANLGVRTGQVFGKRSCENCN